MRLKYIMIATLAVLMALPAIAAEKEGVAITIYNDGLAVVKEKRFINLRRGISEIKFKDVAKRIDATSVHFKSFTDASTAVVEQNYEFDLVSASKLLEKYIDLEIAVSTKGGRTYEGVLMSFDSSQLVLKDSNTGALTMVRRSRNVKNITFKSLPKGLMTKPTLVWRVNTRKGGRHLTQVTYMTGGVSWKCDYTIITKKGVKSLDLSGWVTINNTCGATFKNAKVKLIAGDVNRVRSGYGGGRKQEKHSGRLRAAGKSRGFAQKSFGEYHMYTLQGTSTVRDNQVKQIEMLNKKDVACKKVYRYAGYTTAWYGYGRANSDPNYGVQCNRKVNMFIEFKNKLNNNLGVPLPKGKIRVYQRDEADGSLEFIGEDLIDHTPKDEDVKVFIGNAFDVVGERKRKDFQRRGNSVEETFEITLRNHKDTEIEVEVWEVMYRWSNWEIVKKSDKFDKFDAQSIKFDVQVPANGVKVISYTVYYWW